MAESQFPPKSPTRSFGTKEISFLISAALYLTIICYLWGEVGIAEDALILFEYSKNLGQGYGITYHTGLGPVEGATAFLWMVYLSLAQLIGIDIMVLSRIGSIVAGLIIIYVVNSHAHDVGLSHSAKSLPAIVVSLTYTPVHTLTGFSTVAFGAVYLLTCVAATKIIKKPESTLWRTQFIILSIVFALIRPEGAILVTGILVYLLILSKNRYFSTLKLSMWFFIPIGLYHVGRIIYYGQIFPNPFYIKTGGSLLQVGAIIRFILTFSRLNIFLMLIAFVGILSIRHKDSSKINRLILFSIPAVTHFLIYLFITQSQNTHFRFQYIYVLMSMIILPYGINEIKKELDKNTKFWSFLPPKIPFLGNSHKTKNLIIFMILAVMVISQPLFIQIVTGPAGITGSSGFGTDPMNSEKQIGRDLGVFSSENYTLMTDQAGALPYFSEWNTIDTGGLNNKYIAHNGLTIEYINRFEPDVIMLYPGFVGTPIPPSCTTEEWNSRYGRISTIMHQYAINNNYSLAAIVRRPGGGYDWYFVRNSNPDSDEITHIIQNQSGVEYVEYNYSNYPRQFSCYSEGV